MTGVLNNRPEYQEYFQRKADVYGQGFDTRFNLIAPAYAANMRALKTTNLSQSMDAAKSKIYDLNFLRESMGQFPLEMYELVLGIPPAHDVTVPDAVHDKVKERTDGLIDTADKLEISVFPVDTVADAVARVSQKAA